MKPLFSNFSMQSVSHGGLTKAQSAGSQPRVSDSGGQAQRLRIHIPKKFPDDVAKDYSFRTRIIKQAQQLLKDQFLLMTSLLVGDLLF